SPSTSVHAYSVFFLIQPRPPGSTLFPYTTLFRSGGIPRVSKKIHSPTDKTSDSATPAGVKESAQDIACRALEQMETLGLSPIPRSEEHTSELQSRENLVCRLLLEKKKQKNTVQAS